MCVRACHFRPASCCESSGATKERWLISLGVTCLAYVAPPSWCEGRDVGCAVSRCAAILWTPSSQGQTDADLLNPPPAPPSTTTAAMLTPGFGRIPMTSCIYNVHLWSFLVPVGAKLQFFFKTAAELLALCGCVCLWVCADQTLSRWEQNQFHWGSWIRAVNRHTHTHPSVVFIRKMPSLSPLSSPLSKKDWLGHLEKS